MARPLKRGIDYFPLDVKFLRNIKVRKILRGCGEKSIAVLISLLGNVYENRGYYIVWSEEVSFLIADEIGVSEGLVQEVVNKALQVNFFDIDIFNKYKILTSKGIQERYLEATTNRKKIELIKEYLAVEVNTINNLVNVYINSINEVDNTQRREEKTKVNKSKEKNNAENKFPADSLEIKTSEYLYKKMLINDSKSKRPNMQKWAEHIDKLMRIDKRNDKEEIWKVIDFATSDSFWKANVLSAEKLRKHYQSILLQMQDKKNNNKKSSRTYYKPVNNTKEIYDAEIESIKRLIANRGK